MKKLFSTPVYFVLSLISALFIVSSIDADLTYQVVGVGGAMVVVLFSTLVFDPLRAREPVRLEAIILLALMYLIFLGMSIITALASYYELFAPASITRPEALFYPGAVAGLIGIFFWIGIGVAVPRSKRRRRRKEMRKEDERLKREMEPREVGFVDFD